MILASSLSNSVTNNNSESLILCRFLVKFRGRVQGVGFRYTCKSVSERFAVVGWVKNLADGSVELLAEGEQAELEAFLQAVQETVSNSTFGNIESLDKETTQIKESSLNSFSIVRS